MNISFKGRIGMISLHCKQRRSGEREILQWTLKITKYYDVNDFTGILIPAYHTIATTINRFSII